MEKSKIITITIIYGVILIVSIILFSFSFSSTPLNHFAIIQNNFTKKIDENRIYNSGRFFIGLGNKFLTYPSNWQIIRFAKNQFHTAIPIDSGTIFSKTKDTANMEISCILIYKLIPGNIFELYKNWQFNIRHRQDVIKIVKSTIAQIINEFNYIEIIRNRKDFSKYVSYKLSIELKTKLLCELQNFILEFIFINQTIENTTENNLILIQTQKTERINNLIRNIDGSINNILSDGITRENQILTQAKITAYVEKSTIDKDKYIFEKNLLRTPYQNLKNLYTRNDYYLSTLYMYDLLKNSDTNLEWKYDLRN